MFSCAQVHRFCWFQMNDKHNNTKNSSIASSTLVLFENVTSAKVNSWCCFSASTSNLISCCMANLSYSSTLDIISSWDLSSVTKLYCSSLLWHFSFYFFQSLTASSFCLTMCDFLFSLFASVGVLLELLQLADTLAASVELQLADVQGDEGLDAISTEVSFVIADSDTNLSLTLLLNARNKTIIPKNWNFSGPPPVAFFTRMLFIILALPFIFQLGQGFCAVWFVIFINLVWILPDFLLSQRVFCFCQSTGVILIAKDHGLWPEIALCISYCQMPHWRLTPGAWLFKLVITGSKGCAGNPYAMVEFARLRNERSGSERLSLSQELNRDP